MSERKTSNQVIEEIFSKINFSENDNEIDSELENILLKSLTEEDNVDNITNYSNINSNIRRINLEDVTILNANNDLEQIEADILRRYEREALLEDSQMGAEEDENEDRYHHTDFEEDYYKNQCFETGSLLIFIFSLF